MRQPAAAAHHETTGELCALALLHCGRRLRPCRLSALSRPSAWRRSSRAPSASCETSSSPRCSGPAPSRMRSFWFSSSSMSSAACWRRVPSMPPSFPCGCESRPRTGADGASGFVAQVLGAMLLAVGALASIGLLLAPMIVGAFCARIRCRAQRAGGRIPSYRHALCGDGRHRRGHRRTSQCRRQGRRRGARNRRLQRRSARGLGVDRCLRAGAAGRQGRHARACDRARRHRATGADRNGLSASAAAAHAPTLRRFRRNAALSFTRRARPPGGRHPATAADRGRHGGVGLAGRGVVALLRQPPL